MRTRSHVDTTVMGAASLLAIAFGAGPSGAADRLGRKRAASRPPAPVGAWSSADGAVRLTINSDGTYAGKVSGRRQAALGTYDVEGETMTLRDESGLWTPVTLHDGELEMAGHRLEPAL